MLKPYIQQIVDGIDLSCAEMQAAIGLIIEGNISEAQIAAFLVSLRIKGETAAEIEGAVRAVMQRMSHFESGEMYVIDTCGTGGDGVNTFNISTAAGILAAAAGAKVVKHGNRAVSSSCGSADVLTALGINIEMDHAAALECLHETNFCFCFAPAYHPAIRNVAATRREIGLRTIFNIIGPLVNPSPIQGQVMGVYDPSLMDKLADVMKQLGRKRAILVHGNGGLDEISLVGPTKIVCMENGVKSQRDILPEDFALDYCALNDLRGGNADCNAQIIRDIFLGEPGGRRDTVVANTATALYVQGMAEDFAHGARLAEAAIDNGSATRTLETLVALSRK